MLGFTEFICVWYSYLGKLMLGFTELICICIWYSTKLMLGLIESKLVKIKEEIEEECWLDVFTEEILSRLPAIELQTLKTVCKNWNRIISSPYFVRLHLKVFNERRIRVLMQNDTGVMIGYTNYCDEEKKIQIRHPPVFSRRVPVVLGSCDGLLCLLLIRRFSEHRSVAIYNPSTGKCLIAKKCPDLYKKKYLYIFGSWFGYHPSSCEEFVLVLGFQNPRIIVGDKLNKVGVYKFSRCGSELNPIHSETCFLDGPLAHFEERGVLLHGVVHWPAEWVNRRRSPSNTVISGYHLDSNKYLEISTPPVQFSNFKLGVVKGCLFVIFKPDGANVFEMWMMKEYKVHQSWNRYAYIHGFNNNRVLSPLGFFPNGDLILDVDKLKVIRYYLDDHKAVILMNHKQNNIYGEAIMCADSLVFPSIS